MFGFSSGMSCCHQWTGCLSPSIHLLFGNSWILQWEEKQEWAIYRTRGEWLLLTSVHLTRTAGEPLECSPVQLVTLVEAAQGISSSTAFSSPLSQASKTCPWAALLCNITLQYWWPLGFCLLKRSSYIWLECAFSLLKPYGAGEGKSRVKQAALHTDDLLECGHYSESQKQLASAVTEEVGSCRAH